MGREGPLLQRWAHQSKKSNNNYILNNLQFFLRVISKFKKKIITKTVQLMICKNKIETLTLSYSTAQQGRFFTSPHLLRSEVAPC